MEKKEKPVQKQKRARSREKKQEQFEKIIAKGRELIGSDKGWEGFGMRALSRELKMSEGNLYNYVKSKRELWIAIRKQYYEEFNEKMKKVIYKNRGKIPYIDLLIKIGEFYLDFSAENRARFRMMNEIPAPRSSEKGPLEKTYRPFAVMREVQSIIEEAIERKEIKPTAEPDILVYFLFGIVYGAAKVEIELKKMTPVLEPIITKRFVSIKEYRNFVFQEIRKLLE